MKSKSVQDNAGQPDGQSKGLRFSEVAHFVITSECGSRPGPSTLVGQGSTLEEHFVNPGANVQATGQGKSRGRYRFRADQGCATRKGGYAIGYVGNAFNRAAAGDLSDFIER